MIDMISKYIDCLVDLSYHANACLYYSPVKKIVQAHIVLIKFLLKKVIKKQLKIFQEIKIDRFSFHCNKKSSFLKYHWTNE